jgi:gluconokinase
VAAVVGVDLGTTATKAVAYDQDGRRLAAASAGYPLAEPQPGRAEQDPQAILAAVRSTVGQVLSEVDGPVAGLAFSSAMHTLVGLGADGTPLTPSLSWADSRASAQAARLAAEDPGLPARTGTPVHPMAPLAKLAWFHEHEPDLAARVAHWCGVKDWVLAQLCGRLVTDVSDASGTGLLALSTSDWDPAALALAGITADRLPPLVPVTTVLDSPSGPVVVGAGDGPLANLGLGAVAPGVGACSIGTSGALRVTVDRPAADPGIFCYALADDRWVAGGAINNGGIVLEWAGHALAPDLAGPAGPADLLAEAARAPAGSDGLLMLPYLLGERAPRWSPLPLGAYVGLTREHGRPHLVRAAIEGVCQQLALVLDSVRGAGHPVTELRATGGFARSPLWRQILADTLGMPVRFPADHEGSGFGAALLGMRALGLLGTLEEAAALVRIEDTVEPGPDAAVYAALRPVFAGLYDALVPAWTALRSLTP